MWTGTCHRCDASSELKGNLPPDKVLCFHLENIRYAKSLLGSSFSIQKVRIWTAGRQLSSHALNQGFLTGGKFYLPRGEDVYFRIIKYSRIILNLFFSNP